MEQVHNEVFGPKVVGILADEQQKTAGKKRYSVGGEIESAGEEEVRASLPIVPKNKGPASKLDMENPLAKTFTRADFRKHRTNKLMRLSKEHQEAGFIYTP